jgi:uncharacterized protein (DUF488 family)
MAESNNNAWHNDSFRGYADYIEQQSFIRSIEKLEKSANEKNVAYMCAEAVWWRCHRSLISDFLKSKGWKVIHIIDINKSEEHPYTKPAKIENGKLTYRDTNAQSELF